MLRSWKAGVAMAALGAVAILGGGGSTAEAKGDLVVKRFLIGRLEPNTDKFVAIGGRGTQNVYRDCVVMLVFSRPIDMSHRSEEHTSELQSQSNLVCRLLLEKKKKKNKREAKADR